MILDIEVYPNYFLLGLLNERTDELYQFELFIDPETGEVIDDLRRIIKFCEWAKREKEIVIGFNIINYDHTVLYKLYRSKNKPLESILEAIYDESQRCVEQETSGLYKDSWLFDLIDLMKIWHYDSLAKKVSLKKLMIGLQLDNVEDLPYPYDATLNDEQRRKVKSYNINDLQATRQFYNTTLGLTDNQLYKGGNKIELRRKLSEKYGIDLLNKSDVAIGKEIFLHKICEVKGIERDKAIKLSSPTKKVVLNRVIKYDKIKFNNILSLGIDYFKNKVINVEKEEEDEEKETKKSVARVLISDENGNNITIPCFNSDEFNMYRTIYKDYNPQYLKGESNSKKGYSVLYKGFIYDFGLGGIHGAKQGVYKSGNGKIIKSIDVESFYPNLCIQLLLTIKHIGKETITIFKELFAERKQYLKGTVENLAMKLALNGSYGMSKDKFSPLYDPYFTYSITVNGQLLLTMLASQLQDLIPNSELIMINTDGLEMVIDEKDNDFFNQICKQWETDTNFVLEYAEFKSLYIRDVNNYVGLTSKDKIKVKGAYEIDKELHKDNSMRICRIAAKDYLLYNKPIEQTIKNHTNILDFAKRFVATKQFKVFYEYADSNQLVKNRITKTNRYIISNKGGILSKKDTNEIRVEASELVTLINQYDKTKPYDVKYDYYVHETKKLIEPFYLLQGDKIIKQNTLF